MSGSSWNYINYTAGFGPGWLGDSSWSRAVGSVLAPDSILCLGLMLTHMDSIIHPPLDSSLVYYRKTDTALLAYNASTRQWYRLLRLPLAVGNGWTVYSDSFGNYDSIVVEACETVTVPAGVFPLCYRLREIMGPGTAAPTYSWYAPGVGPVMDSTGSATGAALAKLRRYHIAK